ncbi:MAG: excinuclease ABC subunit UvrC [Anaerovoracaceae bacterium]
MAVLKAMFNIEENLKKLPETPGVYIHKDKLGQVIYVGKAISLKNRVRQYFRSTKNMDPKVKAMVSHIAEFEYITCGSEMEAFILENNLIKQYRPKYNILLRDDKTYPYIKVTTSEAWPRVVKTRVVGKGKDKYFGPYSDAGAVNQMVEFLNNLYGLKKCSAINFPEGFRPCLNYHIGKCEGICAGKGDQEAYLQRVELVLDYLKGKNKKITDYLQEKMEGASEALNFEAAAKYRDYLLAAKALSEKQRVVLKAGMDMDVVLSGGRGHIVLFFVRDGKLTGRETFSLQMAEGDPISAFLRQHYGEETHGPSEILVARIPEEKSLIEAQLSALWGRKVSIIVPQKGEKKALLDLALRNVAEMTKTIESREKNRQEQVLALGNQLHQVLSQVKTVGEYSGQTYRVEAYDVSNTNGVDTVGAMVCFQGMKPDKKAYRRFKIRTVEGPNDYGSMQEMLYRRLKKAIEGDAGFLPLPDALLIDGGRGHVAAAKQIVDAMKLQLPVLGMAKDDHHRTRALVFVPKEEGAAAKGEDRFVETQLNQYPLLFKFFGRIQEEVHRFAITYHRGLRDNKQLTSVLDEIPGIGKAKRNALLAHFGSIEGIKKAGEEQLKEVPGITEKLAKNIRKYFD